MRFKIKKAILYPLNFLLTWLLLCPPILGLFIKINPGEKQRIPLVSHQAMDLARANGNFHFSSFDIFEKSPEPFDIIRAMNVLNVTYFTPEEVKKIASSIYASLKDGGIFIVGSNMSAGTEVNGDLLVKRNGRFESLLKFGRGANFRDVILSQMAG